MREIKFQRAFFKDEAKTQFSHFSEWGADIGRAAFTSPGQNNFALYFTDRQFTGLKDKNGVEIYEGDILQIYEWDDISHKDKKRFISTVEFRRGAFMVYDTTIELWRSFENLARPGEPFEVIGNIYSNPSMIK